jgi:hypothetical protein
MRAIPGQFVTLTVAAKLDTETVRGQWSTADGTNEERPCKFSNTILAPSGPHVESHGCSDKATTSEIPSGIWKRDIIYNLWDPSWSSSVSIVTRLRAERPGFNSRQGNGLILFATASRQALGPTQSRIQCVLGALSPGIKRLAREADQSPPSSAENKNAWSYASTLTYVFMSWCLVK